MSPLTYLRCYPCVSYLLSSFSFSCLRLSLTSNVSSAVCWLLLLFRYLSANLKERYDTPSLATTYFEFYILVVYSIRIHTRLLLICILTLFLLTSQPTPALTAKKANSCKGKCGGYHHSLFSFCLWSRSILPPRELMMTTTRWIC